MDRLMKDDTAAGGPGDRLLYWRQVKSVVGLSRSTIWRMQRAGDFPASVQVSPGRTGWWESQLEAWKRARTPGHMPEPRPFARPDPSPPRSRLPEPPEARTASEPPLPESVETPSVERPGFPKTQPARMTRARRSQRGSVSPDQTAFDFGP